MTPQDSHKCARPLTRNASPRGHRRSDPRTRSDGSDPDWIPVPAGGLAGAGSDPWAGSGFGTRELQTVGSARALWLGRCPARGVSVVLTTVWYVPCRGRAGATGPTRHRHSTTPCLSRAVLMGRGPYIAMPEAIRASWTATLSTPACGHASRIHADAMCRTQSRTCVHAEKTE